MRKQRFEHFFIKMQAKQNEETLIKENNEKRNSPNELILQTEQLFKIFF